MGNELAWKGDSGLIDVRLDEGVAVLRLNRPDKLNALTIEMLRDIAVGLRSFGDGSKADAMVITGEGRAFSAGDDLKMTEDLDEAGFQDLIKSFQALTFAVLESEVPVIAALNGLVVGGAAEWSLSCDARVGCSATYFLFPENGVGLTISNASTYLLPRLLGGRALPIVLGGERIQADEAARLGLVDYLVERPADAVAKAIELARAWSRPGLSTSLHIKMLRPPIAEIEKAIERENGFAGEVWKRDLARRGIGRFYSSRNDAGS
jgi:enoyl-CoA hydratase/carnithine racemase